MFKIHDYNPFYAAIGKLQELAISARAAFKKIRLPVEDEEDRGYKENIHDYENQLDADTRLTNRPLSDQDLMEWI